MMNTKLSAFLAAIIFTAVKSFSQTGCTDLSANNYNAAAVGNNGSCTYDSTHVSAHLKGIFASLISESSGLVFTDGNLWTHNDSGGQPELYRVDTANGHLLQTIHVDNFPNVDWEDLTADSSYIYIADCGNNNGTRTNLKILRIDKTQITQAATVHVNAQAIDFLYADQTSFASSSTHNFDCEAVVSIGSSLYLFTKDRGDLKTRCYQLAKTPGTYVLTPYTTFDTKGLITGAAYNRTKNEITLIGYLSSHIYPFMWVLNDFQGNQFFSGNKRRFELGNGGQIWQTEGIDYALNNELFISCESSVDVSASLYNIDMTPWKLVTGIAEETNFQRSFAVYPNPAENFFTIDSPYALSSIAVYTMDGSLCAFVAVENSAAPLTLNTEEQHLIAGIYFIKINSTAGVCFKKLVVK
jgi:hypothetical protein